MRISLHQANTLFMPTSASAAYLLCMLVLLLALCLNSSPAQAGTQHYQAPLDSVSWTASSNTSRCSLKHDIPLYGQATFSQAAGEKLGFSMKVKRKASRKKDRAHLQSLPPNWKHQVAAVDLGEIAVHKGDTPFKVNESLSRRMLVELQKGMYPTLTYRDWADARDEVTVSLAGINIKEVLDKFIGCLAKLPIYKFADFKNSLIRFDFGKHQLTTKARKRLDAVVKYLKSDPKVKQIIVDGHTDNVGRRRSNDKLGGQRSRAVKKYLVSKGAPAKKFKLQSYGERKPEQSNRTDKGRANNRRAFLTLVK